MEIRDLIQKTFGTNPAAAPAPGITTAGVLQASAPPPPKPTKNDSLSPAIMSEAQTTFTGSGHAQGSPEGGKPGTPPSKGTGASMIPPGWSSQAGK